MPLQEDQKQLFYAWECINIQMEHRDVDLVIQKEDDMLNLIALLVFELETFNGQKATAAKVFKGHAHLK